jgi:hypothetical protein
MKNSKGFILIISTFLLMSVFLILTAYWKILQIQGTKNSIKEYQIQSYFAAKSGIEEAISEIRQGHTFAFGTTDLSPQWEYVAPNTFKKSTIGPIPITHFKLPVTYTVIVSGNPSTDIVTIKSTSLVSGISTSENVSHTFEAQIVKSPGGEVSILSTKEL